MGAQMRRMVLEALNNPVGQPPLREKLRRLKAEKENPKVRPIMVGMR